MHAIKIVLISVVLLLVLWAFRNRNRVGIRAGARLLGLLLAVFAVASILDTGIPQGIANHLGVARGTDLILYGFVLVYVLTTTGTYFRSRELERRMVGVVRSVAIGDAVAADGPPRRAEVEPTGVDAKKA